MDEPPIASATKLTRIDLMLLLGYCAVLFGPLLALNSLLSTHESIHCQNVREMLIDGDWVIPHYGGRPWLERPPLPHWLTAAFVVITGQYDQPWAYRLGSAVAGMLGVLIVAATASRLFGRWVGLSSGVLLATMREFAHYTLAPECDVFLCVIVTSAMAAFAHCEFGAGQSQSFRVLGARPWPFLAGFVLLGAANLAKGLFFGMSLALAPIAAYLIGRLRRGGWSGYIWLWGGLAFLATASAWPLAAWIRHPDVISLWESDYVGRLSRDYMREPVWYYLLQLPWVIFPWSLFAAVGLATVWRRGWSEAQSPQRFLLCWAIAPIVLLSIPRGKHHHYLLPALAPWAILAAMGTKHFLLWLRPTASTTSRHPWTRHPWLFPVCLAVVSSLAVLGIISWRVPALWPIAPAILLFCIAVVMTGWRLLHEPRPRRALAGVALLALLLTWILQGPEHLRRESYRDDFQFVEQVREHLDQPAPVYVLADHHVLDASWILFYLPDEVPLLHNVTYLHDARLPETIQLVARVRHAASLAKYGATEIVAQSTSTRSHRRDGELWTLFKLRLRPDLWRGPPAAISPMQATGRAPGPFLLDSRAAANRSTGD